MRLPADQPRRALAAVAGYLLALAVGSALLVLWRGPALGTVLTVAWGAALTVPFTVIGHLPAPPLPPDTPVATPRLTPRPPRSSRPRPRAKGRTADPSD